MGELLILGEKRNSGSSTPGHFDCSVVSIDRNRQPINSLLVRKAKKGECFRGLDCIYEQRRCTDDRNLSML